MRARFEVAEDHFVSGTNGNPGGLRTEGLVVHNASMSTSGLVAVLSLWSQSLGNADMIRRTLAVLRSLVKLLPSRCTLVLEQPVPNVVGPLVIQEIKVEVIDGVLQPCPALQPQMQFFPHLWPHTATECIMLPRHFGKRYDCILGQLFRAFGKRLESVVSAMGLAEASSLLALCRQPGQNIDIDVQVAVGRLSRNTFRLGVYAKTLQKHVGAHNIKIDCREQIRYWMATRKAMVTSTTHALTTDATRFKLDINAGLMCNITTGTFGWAPPMVHSKCKNIDQETLLYAKFSGSL